MGASDARRAVRYLLVVVIAYTLVSLGSGRGIRPLELVVFALGAVALVLVADRLGD